MILKDRPFSSQTRNKGLASVYEFTPRKPVTAMKLRVALGLFLLAFIFTPARNPTAAQPTCPPADCVPGKDAGREFFVGVINSLVDVPLSDFAVDALVIWEPYEGTNACWNPLATTWNMGIESCPFNPPAAV